MYTFVHEHIDDYWSWVDEKNMISTRSAYMMLVATNLDAKPGLRAV